MDVLTKKPAVPHAALDFLGCASSMLI